MKEGQYTEAEQLMRQTLQMERRTLGPQYYDTLITMDNLGELLKTEKQYSEAEKTYREELEGWRKAVGPSHPDTALAAYSLACDLALEGKQEQALENLKFALEHALPAGERHGWETDPDLTSLHGDPRFAALVASPASRH